MSDPTPPRSREQVADLHFMDARYKLLDLAAFLDRLDRAAGGERDVLDLVAALEDAEDFAGCALRGADVLADGAHGVSPVECTGAG